VPRRAADPAAEAVKQITFIAELSAMSVKLCGNPGISRREKENLNLP
jgi:hypothetical protein